MGEVNQMSKDRLKEELEGVKKKKSIFFWIAISFIMPGIMTFVIYFLMGGTYGGGFEFLLIIGAVITIIGLIFGKIHLNYKSKYKELRDKL